MNLFVLLLDLECENKHIRFVSVCLAKKGEYSEELGKMSQTDNRYSMANAQAQQGAVVDEGLRSYMLGVYNYMTLGVALTGIVAFAVFSALTTNDPSQAAAQMRNGVMLTELGAAVYTGWVWFIIALSPLAFIMIMSFARLSAANAQMVFWAFAAVMGISMSSIFIRFTGGSITQVFFVASAAFAALSLYGYTTKKDLSGWGSFLIMGVVGIILAGIVNFFLQSSALQFAISVIGLLVFAGLTAYDTQRIKDEYYHVAGDQEAVAQASIFGALSLYLDFVNMFQFLLALMGNDE